MRKLWVLVLMVLLVSCSVETPEPIKTPSPPVQQIEEIETPEEITPPEFNGVIEGSERFKQKIEESLEYLEEHYNEGYLDICKYVEYIGAIRVEDYFAYSKPDERKIYFSKECFEYEWTDPGRSLRVEWIIPVTLIHETQHIKDFERRTFSTVYQLEKWALEAEREFFRAMGVDEETIEEVAGEHLLETRWWEN